MLPITGSIPTTEASLYTVPAIAGARLDWLQAENAAAGQAVVQFWLTVRGVKAALTAPVPLASGSLMTVIEASHSLRLSKGCVLSASSSVVGVTYVIAGEEL